MNPASINPAATTRVDLHCHSTASEISKLGIQRSLGLPECATPPKEVYDLAKRRGMDLVTITDHDTIDGCLAIADRPDVFISEELTAWFAGEQQAVHVLCFGISPADHEWLQAHNRDLEACASYLHENEIACSLAHPFYAVEAPLTPAHRRRLAQLFPVWETRNGSRARELNMPAAIYIETHGGTGTGGSDDHAGVDIGRTYTETPPAATPEQFLRHIREGRAEAHGEQGSAAKWAHAAMALATRALLIADAGSNGSARRAAGGSGGRAEDGRARDERGRRPPRLGRRRPRTRGRARPAGGLHRLDRARPQRSRPGRAHAVRGLQPRRARAPRQADPRAQAARGGREHRRALQRRRRARRPGRCRDRHRPRAVRRRGPRDPLRAGGRLPRQGEGEADARRRAQEGRPDRRRDRRRPRRHAHDRAHPRPRGPGPRGRGRRNRPQRRPAAAGGGRGGGSLLRRARDRDPQSAGHGRGAGRGPVRHWSM